MNGSLSKSTVIALVRIVIGFLFVAASVGKISSPEAFAVSIVNYRIVALPVAFVFATILPWMELLCGLALLFGIWIRGSCLLLSFMLVLFTFAVISALFRGLDISCGCFTQDPSASKIGWAKVGENILLFSGSILVFYANNARLSLEQYFRSHPPPEVITKNE